MKIRIKSIKSIKPIEDTRIETTSTGAQENLAKELRLDEEKQQHMEIPTEVIENIQEKISQYIDLSKHKEIVWAKEVYYKNTNVLSEKLWKLPNKLQTILLDHQKGLVRDPDTVGSIVYAKKHWISLLYLSDEEYQSLIDEKDNNLQNPDTLEALLDHRKYQYTMYLLQQYEALFQVESGKWIMSLGGLITQPMSSQAREAMIQNFAEIEQIDIEEANNIINDFHDEIGAIKKLHFEGKIMTYLNENISTYSTLGYITLLQDIDNNPKYQSIIKYSNIPDYNNLFFQWDLWKLDPNYKSIK